jgi:hypothetical protein
MKHSKSRTGYLSTLRAGEWERLGTASRRVYPGGYGRHCCDTRHGGDKPRRSQDGSILTAWCITALPGAFL